MLYYGEASKIMINNNNFMSCVVLCSVAAIESYIRQAKRKRQALNDKGRSKKATSESDSSNQLMVRFWCRLCKTLYFKYSKKILYSFQSGRCTTVQKEDVAYIYEESLQQMLYLTKSARTNECWRSVCPCTVRMNKKGLSSTLLTPEGCQSGLTTIL